MKIAGWMAAVSAGVMCLSVLSGCVSTDPQLRLAQEVQEAQAVLEPQPELEDHNSLPEKCVFANLLLENTKELYLGWAVAGAKIVKLRFGEADMVSVIRDVTDNTNLKLWEALRNETSDPEKAKAAEAARTELKKLIVESYRKNKTTSHFTDEEVCESVFGKIAQADYVEYCEKLRKGEATEADYKDRALWLARGKADIAKDAAMLNALVEEQERLLAPAEEKSREAFRKVELTVLFYGALFARALAVQQAAGTDNQFMKLGFIAAAKAAEGTMNAAREEFPEVDQVLEVPPGTDLTRVENLTAILINHLQTQLEPYSYAVSVGGQRMDRAGKVKEWSRRAAETLAEVSGEK